MINKNIELWRGDQVTVCLMDTRAARDIRIDFSFERDGWVVSTLKAQSVGEDKDFEWVEKAFIPSFDEGDLET